MTGDKPQPTLRFRLAAFPERYSLPPRPTSATATVVDAHRQTNFLLPDDLFLFERVMNVQLQVVAANAKARTPQAAGLFTMWSRAFSSLADACALTVRASYSSATPLLRAAIDCVAVQRSFIADGFAEYEEWFAAAVTRTKERTAIAYDIGRIDTTSILAADERLGMLQRLLSDLASPNFGPSTLVIAPDTNHQKITAGFADNAFHLGWAELQTGWLNELAAAQVRTVLEADIFSLTATLRTDAEAAVRDVAASAEGGRRCYVEPEGDHFVFYNFRRTATGQQRRIIL
ncbi:MAG: hypothetical protein J4N36_02405 [Chloroflexi bacterium]|nr:hypothetical protein [Chloroflexota bacterium]MCI0818103.1 hypothetical protein [Chloroflexota bacterium]MCI0831657.1 hypothetical protein [Chloroflexota bacterium]MCI0842593.1 hypothetical protein [Chloroflexota bacterium]MCI0884071.1 hypothetical protein [Chloroflexota bacterium]